MIWVLKVEPPTKSNCLFGRACRSVVMVENIVCFRGLVDIGFYWLELASLCSPQNSQFQAGTKYGHDCLVLDGMNRRMVRWPNVWQRIEQRS